MFHVIHINYSPVLDPSNFGGYFTTGQILFRWVVVFLHRKGQRPSSTGRWNLCETGAFRRKKKKKKKKCGETLGDLEPVYDLD